MLRFIAAVSGITFSLILIFESLFRRYDAEAISKVMSGEVSHSLGSFMSETLGFAGLFFVVSILLMSWPPKRQQSELMSSNYMNN